MSRVRIMFLMVCMISGAFFIQGFWTHNAEAAVVGVEIYSDDPEKPGKDRDQAGLPWNEKGKLGQKIDPKAQIYNPYKNLLRYEAKRRAKKDIQSLKNGDSLVIGFHSDPRGFKDGSEFVEWKDFWRHFDIDPIKAPRLKSVVVCGCMASFPSGLYGTLGIVKIPIDENGVNHIRNCLNADTAFVSRTTYDILSLDDAKKIVDWLNAGKSLAELKRLVGSLKNFHFMEDSRPPSTKKKDNTIGTEKPKTAPTGAERTNAYKNGYNVGKQVRNGTMSMDDVKRLMRDLYGDVSPELKASFRKGYADGSAE